MISPSSIFFKYPLIIQHSYGTSSSVFKALWKSILSTVYKRVIYRCWKIYCASIKRQFNSIFHSKNHRRREAKLLPGRSWTLLSPPTPLMHSGKPEALRREIQMCSIIHILYIGGPFPTPMFCKSDDVNSVGTGNFPNITLRWLLQTIFNGCV